MGFESDKGSGEICKAIQSTGKRIAGKNRLSNWAAVEISPCGPKAASATIVAAASVVKCDVSATLATAKAGVAASNAIKRRKAIDKFANFGVDGS